MKISTLLTPAVRRTHVIHATCIWPRSSRAFETQWLEHPTGVRKVIGSIPVGPRFFSLSHAREMLITSFLNINAFKPLGPKSVQHQFSPNNISRSTRVKVMRITKLMTKGKTL